jgi:hypothetical protein
MNHPGPEKDYEIYKQLMNLWVKENTIKTSKLQTLLLTNALLLIGVSIHNGFVAKNWPIYLGGTVACLIWLFSIGRTVLFQKKWQSRMTQIATQYPNDIRFQIHRDSKDSENLSNLLLLIGRIPSKYYLIGTPLIFVIAWFIALLYFFLR